MRCCPPGMLARDPVSRVFLVEGGQCRSCRHPLSGMQLNRWVPEGQRLLSISHICLHRHFRHRGATPATEGGENPPEIQVFKHQRGAYPVSRPFWRPRTQACCVLTLFCTVRAQNRETDRSKEIRLVFRNHVLSSPPTILILEAVYIYRRKLDVTKERVLLVAPTPLMFT